jgi:hypothetical protein
MSQRVDVGAWIQYQWPYMLAWLGGEKRVNERAYETAAFVRRREIQSPADLLQLILTWAVGRCSLRETVALAAEAGLVDISDVALLKRISRSSGWLTSLLTDLLADRIENAAERSTRIRLLDATAISSPGQGGTSLRVHMAMQLGTHCCDTIEVTDGRGAESLDRFAFSPGEIVIADTGYAHRAALARVAEAGAHFLVRLPWSSLPLETLDGEPFDLFAALDSLSEAEPGEFAVQFRPSKARPVVCRLIAIRKTEALAAEARQRVLANSRRHGAKAIDRRTLEYAGFICILTNAPAELSSRSILDLYRFRWQIEMKFKNLKSVLDLDNVPTRSPELLKAYVLAKLLVAVVIDHLLSAESFFPWGYPMPADQLLAPQHDPA